MNERQPHCFLPDFCRWTTVVTALVLCELFAIILVVAQLGQLHDAWQELALISLFMQWAGLCCIVFLCLVRGALARLGFGWGALVAYLGLLLVVLSLSEVSYRLILGELLPATDLSHADYLLRNLLISATICALVLRYFHLQHQRNERMKAESEARLQALQARIRPHFLFNTLNTIVSLVRREPELAEGALLNMADLFRAALSDGPGLVPARDELALVRGYLDIEALRLGKRLAVEYHLEELPEDALLPALSLQPLVENAIYHGIEALPEGGVVSLVARRKGEQIELEISNPVNGLPGREGSGCRVAQESVHLRLMHYFPEAAGMRVSCTDDQYRVCFGFPYRSCVT